MEQLLLPAQEMGLSDKRVRMSFDEGSKELDQVRDDHKRKKKVGKSQGEECVKEETLSHTSRASDHRMMIPDKKDKQESHIEDLKKLQTIGALTAEGANDTFFLVKRILDKAPARQFTRLTFLNMLFRHGCNVSSSPPRNRASGAPLHRGAFE